MKSKAMRIYADVHISPGRPFSKKCGCTWLDGISVRPTVAQAQAYRVVRYWTLYLKRK